MDFDFSSYNQDFELFTKNLPDFERRYLFNLSEKEKHDLFSDVLKRFFYKELTFEKSLYLFIKIAIESLTSKCHEFYLSLFRDLPIEKAKKLAKESVIREKHTLNSKLTYGEIDFFSFLSILEIVNPSKNDVLVDLGHGTGRAIVCASLLYGSLLKKIIGIEIIPELNLGSLEIIENLKSILNSNAFFSGHSLDLVVQEGDFTTYDYFNWSDVDIIFANSTCFDDDLMELLSKKASNLKSGAKIITFTKELENKDLKIIDRRQFAMSWGTATSIIHQRI